MEQQPIIRLEGVSKTFGSGENAVHALQDIDLSIREGEIFGIIGLSGAGKSTLVRCINLLEKPTSGKVFVSGQELTSLPEHQLRAARRNIGMIFRASICLCRSPSWITYASRWNWRGYPKKKPVPGPRPCWTGWGWETGPTPFPPSCPAGRSSG